MILLSQILFPCFPSRWPTGIFSTHLMPAWAKNRTHVSRVELSQWTDFQDALPTEQPRPALKNLFLPLTARNTAKIIFSSLETFMQLSAVENPSPRLALSKNCHHFTANVHNSFLILVNYRYMYLVYCTPENLFRTSFRKQPKLHILDVL